MRKQKNAFTLVELLVVIGIIGVLISILLPALVKARIQSRYVRWQAYSRDMSLDSNIALLWNFQNDRGTPYFTNSAVQNQDMPGYNPEGCNATILSWNGWAIDTPSEISALWKSDGRFPGKPAVTMSSLSQHAWPTPQNSGPLASLLEKSQQVTVMMWIYVPIGEFAQTNSAVLWWTTGTGVYHEFLGVDVYQYSGNTGKIEMYAGYDGSPAHDGDNVQFDNLTYPPDGGNWMLFCFTKNVSTGTMKIYQDGILVAASVGQTQPFMNADLKAPSIDGGQGLTFGQLYAQTYFQGSVDEIAIFDADLSPTNDVTSTGGLLQGIPATRFLSMYQMGTPF